MLNYMPSKGWLYDCRWGSRERCDINEICSARKDFVWGREGETKNTNPVYFEMCDRHNIVLSTGGCMYLICFCRSPFFSALFFWDRTERIEYGNKKKGERDKAHTHKGIMSRLIFLFRVWCNRWMGKNKSRICTLKLLPVDRFWLVNF